MEIPTEGTLFGLLDTYLIDRIKDEVKKIEAQELDDNIRKLLMQLMDLRKQRANAVADIRKYNTKQRMGLPENLRRDVFFCKKTNIKTTIKKVHKLIKYEQFLKITKDKVETIDKQLKALDEEFKKLLGVPVFPRHVDFSQEQFLILI